MDDNLVFGRIPVINVLTGKRKPIRIFLNINHPDKEIMDLARNRSVAVKLITNEELNHLVDNLNH